MLLKSLKPFLLSFFFLLHISLHAEEDIDFELEELIDSITESDLPPETQEDTPDHQAEIDTAIDSLVSDSPFLPPGYIKPSPPRPSPDEGFRPPPRPIPLNLEFRSMVTMGKESIFSLYDTKKKQGFWVRQNDPTAEILVKRFNPLSNSITIQTRSGHTQELVLKTTEVGSQKSGNNSSNSGGLLPGVPTPRPTPKPTTARPTARQPMMPPKPPQNGKQPLDDVSNLSDEELEEELLQFLEELSKQLEGIDQ